MLPAAGIPTARPPGPTVRHDEQKRDREAGAQALGAAMEGGLRLCFPPRECQARTLLAPAGRGPGSGDALEIRLGNGNGGGDGQENESEATEVGNLSLPHGW